MFGIRRNSQQRLGRCLKQQTIDRSLVLIGDVSDLNREREDYVEVFDWQQVFHARLHPALRRSALALWAVAIATRVIGDVLMITFCASRNVTAEGCRAAILNRRHHLQLWQVQVPCLFTTIGTAMGAEDVRDLQFGAGHDGPT
jgi:hypothetical protein